MNAAEITDALRTTLPAPFQSEAPSFAQLLVDVAVGTLTPDEAQRRLAAEFPTLLQTLLGKQLQTPTSVLSFTGNDQQGATITVSGNVAGGDIISDNTITLTVPITTQTISGSYNAQAANGSTATVNVHHTYTSGGDYAEGNIDKRKGIFVSADEIATKLWHLLRRYKGLLAIVIVLEGLLAALYLPWRDLYLLSGWLWASACLLVIVATWLWYTYITQARSRMKLAISALTTLLLAGVIAWSIWPIFFPKRFATQIFGIVVAELGAGADFQRTQSTREVSAQIYTQLCKAIHSDFADEANADFCESTSRSDTTAIVELKQIGVIPNIETAHAYGKRTRADVVIWGQIFISESGKTTIHFQMLETLDRAVNPEHPLVLPVTATSTEIFARQILDSDTRSVEQMVAQQATFISSFTLGLAAYLNRDYPLAVQRFENAEKTIRQSSLVTVSAPGKALMYFYLGSAYHAMGHIEKGQQWLLRAEQENPHEPAIPLALALGYNSQGNSAAHEKYLNKSFDLSSTWLATHPNDSAARYDRGTIYQIRKQYESAARDFQAVIERDPDYYVAYISLALVMVQQGEYEKAKGELYKAIDLATKTGANPCWVYLNLAQVYQRDGEIEKAKQWYQQALNAAPHIDWMFFHYGRFLEQQHEPDAALEAYESLLNVTHNKGWAYGLLGDFRRKHGWLVKAVENYKQAIHEQPTNALLRTYLAETYFQLGEREQALLEFEEAVKYAGSNHYVYGMYAIALASFQRYEDAVQQFERALSIRPDNYQLLLHAGQAYENGLRQRDKAAQLYAKAAALRPNEYSPLLSLARVHEALGEQQKAVATYCQLLRFGDLLPPNETTHVHERLTTLGAVCPSQ